jgi:hypothetical protein
LLLVPLNINAAETLAKSIPLINVPCSLSFYLYFHPAALTTDGQIVPDHREEANKFRGILPEGITEFTQKTFYKG